MAKQDKPYWFCIALVLVVVVSHSGVLCGIWTVRAQTEYISAVGDPGMRRDGLRLAIESWNQCNEVGEEIPYMGSPRLADCFDIYKSNPMPKEGKNCLPCNWLPYILVHRDPGTPPARRRWMSVDLGTEIFEDPDQVAEWTVSDFDILVPKQ
ncbi:hypothetical protein L1049_009924 [Liquidambar formosana]|uniref:DUF7705 domain-containing protein n=1 Tax=Liquidambar formosana TaxID=63359 RepID=A0AAP0R6K5_LIQFO